MKKNDVQIGRTYVAKVSGRLAQVRIDAEGRLGGWDATNIATNRQVHIKSAQRLRRAVGSEPNGEPTPAETAAAQEDAPQYDPNRCGTSRCRGTPVMTYLERPMCQACWDRHCSEDQPHQLSETADDACRPSEEQETPQVENDMATKKTTKKQSKTQPTAAKPKREKKAATPKAKATGEQKPKRVSALDAAATVLKKAGRPMRAQELINAMAAQALWKSPGGKTPPATVYAAILREITAKGKEARFKKVERGQFEFVG